MDIVKNIFKVIIICGFYFGVGPTFGFLVKDRDQLRRVVLAFFAFMLVRPPSNITLMLYSIETYRGHAKGFEFNFLEPIAFGFALAAVLEKRRDFSWFPPGLWIWLLWVVVSTFSIVNAIEPLYTLMPAFKFGKMAFIYVGIFAAVRDERDLLAMMRGFAVALIVQVLYCLWSRYVLGMYRISGWFEHSNPMSMWSYTVAIPLLSLALTKETKSRDVLLFFLGFGSAGLAVVLTVSRAALAVFAVGAALVTIGSFAKGFTLRRVMIVIVGAIGGAVVLAVSADTFAARAGNDDDPKNDLRYALNQQSLAMFNDHPLVGIGWNNYGLANSRPLGMKYSKVLEQWEAARGSRIYAKNFMANPLTESLYWLLLAENGALGFGLFICFIAWTIWQALLAMIRNWRGPLALFYYGLFITLSLTYAHAKVERILSQTKNLTTWVMLCALVSRATWNARNLPKPLPAPRQK